MNAGQNALNLRSHIWFLLTYGSHFVSTALPLVCLKTHMLPLSWPLNRIQLLSSLKKEVLLNLLTSEL